MQHPTAVQGLGGHLASLPWVMEVRVLRDILRLELFACRPILWKQYIMWVYTCVSLPLQHNLSLPLKRSITLHEHKYNYPLVIAPKEGTHWFNSSLWGVGVALWLEVVARELDYLSLNFGIISSDLFNPVLLTSLSLSFNMESIVIPLYGDFVMIKCILTLCAWDPISSQLIFFYYYDFLFDMLRVLCLIPHICGFPVFLLLFISSLFTLWLENILYKTSIF